MSDLGFRWKVVEVKRSGVRWVEFCSHNVRCLKILDLAFLVSNQVHWRIMHSLYYSYICIIFSCPTHREYVRFSNDLVNETFFFLPKTNSSYALPRKLQWHPFEHCLFLLRNLFFNTIILMNRDIWHPQLLYFYLFWFYLLGFLAHKSLK